jgi:hypothetical protein
LEERLGQPVQAVAVLGEELHGIFVRLPRTIRRFSSSTRCRARSETSE